MQWIEDRIERIPIGGCWIWMGYVRKYSDVAASFGISHQQVSNIKLGISWSHI